MLTIRPSLRWLLIPVAAIGGCSGSVAIIDAMDRGVDRIAGPARVEAFLATDTRVGLTYAIAAFLFVAAACIAPSNRTPTATVLYACGAALAWSELNPWYFPEGHPRGYQPSLAPLVLTLVGGAIGVFAAMAYERSQRDRPVQP